MTNQLAVRTLIEAVSKDLQQDLQDVLEGISPNDLQAYFDNMFETSRHNFDQFNKEWSLSEMVTLAKLFTKVLDWADARD